MIRVYCDGLCEPVNPGGTACYGWVVYQDGEKLTESCGVACNGPAATNNVAEYMAVIRALEWLKENEYLDAEIEVCSDSQLVIYQLAGKYAVHSPRILPLYRRAKALAEEFPRLRFTWVPREKNSEADALSRKAYAAYTAARMRRLNSRLKKGRIAGRA
ncbi:MAG: ribonuclease HI [Thermacetogeniaceae bacterium]